MSKQALDAILVRHCESLDEFQQCLAMEKTVWGASDLDVVPSAIFVVAKETGGQVLGAFDSVANGKMVGFTLAMPGFHGQQRYLHSHMTAVLEEYRNRGVGRALKLFQRHDAMERGINLVEWTFDPLELRNAHFNLEGLGAIVRHYLPNVYGITSSPLHSGMPTDRLVAEWWLNSPRARSRAAARTTKQSAVNPAPSVRVRVPREIQAIKARDLQEAIQVQSRLREQFRHWFQRNYMITGVEFTEASGDYLLEPYANPETLPA